VDLIQQLSYEKDCMIQFVVSRGDAFQRFFESVMSKRYPGDFMACRPWGGRGDRKNDSYVPSARTLFQVYGPEEMSSAKTVRKIDQVKRARDRRIAVSIPPPLSGLRPHFRC